MVKTYLLSIRQSIHQFVYINICRYKLFPMPFWQMCLHFFARLKQQTAKRASLMEFSFFLLAFKLNQKNKWKLKLKKTKIPTILSIASLLGLPDDEINFSKSC